jgi:hypothetical protein
MRQESAKRCPSLAGVASEFYTLERSRSRRAKEDGDEGTEVFIRAGIIVAPREMQSDRPGSVR